MCQLAPIQSYFGTSTPAAADGAPGIRRGGPGRRVDTTPAGCRVARMLNQRITIPLEDFRITGNA